MNPDSFKSKALNLVLAFVWPVAIMTLSIFLGLTAFSYSLNGSGIF